MALSMRKLCKNVFSNFLPGNSLTIVPVIFPRYKSVLSTFDPQTMSLYPIIHSKIIFQRKMALSMRTHLIRMFYLKMCGKIQDVYVSTKKFFAQVASGFCYWALKAHYASL